MGALAVRRIDNDPDTLAPLELVSCCHHSTVEVLFEDRNLGFRALARLLRETRLEHQRRQALQDLFLLFCESLALAKVVATCAVSVFFGEFALKIAHVLFFQEHR